MKRSLKYLLIVFANMALLLGLLALWSDPLQIKVNQWPVAIGVMHILLVTVGALIGLRVLVAFFRRRNIEIRKRLKISVVFTLLISSWLYIGYTIKAVNNRLINPKVRQEALLKLHENSFPGGSGFLAINLTSQEYKQIALIEGFTMIPNTAYNINIDYTISGIHREYMFGLTYHVPSGTEAPVFENYNGDVIERQWVEDTGGSILVNYSKARH